MANTYSPSKRTLSPIVAAAAVCGALFIAGCSATEGAGTPNPGAGGQTGNPEGFGGMTALASGQQASWVAIDRHNVYWTNRDPSGLTENDAVMKVPIAGGAPTKLASAKNPGRLAVTETTVYFVDGDGTSIKAVRKYGGRVGTIAKNQKIGMSIAADADGVFWMGERGTIMKVPDTSPGAIALVMGQDTSCGWGEEGGASALALDWQNVYWANCEHAIMKVPKAGGAAERVVSLGEGHRATAIAVYWNSVYWIDANVYPPNSFAHEVDQAVMKAPLLGGRATTLVPRTHQVGAIFVDGAGLFLSGNETSCCSSLIPPEPTFVEKVPVTGGKALRYAAFEGAGVRNIVGDQDNVYFALDDGRIMRMSKVIKLIKPTNL